MALTEDLVARVHRPCEDAGPEPHLTYHAEADYRALADQLIAQHPGGDTWLFAYGSLIWKPEVAHVEARYGTARGWHRSFCFRINRFRATRERPGLMMSLDRGGQCAGVLYRLSPDDLQAQLVKILRREISVKPPNNLPRWIPVTTGHEVVRAIGFVMNRQSTFYVGRLPPEEVAATLAESCGHWGSCAEYLRNTVQHLEAHGIHDRYLWTLQELVAAKIAAATASSGFNPC